MAHHDHAPTTSFHPLHLTNHNYNTPPTTTTLPRPQYYPIPPSTDIQLQQLPCATRLTIWKSLSKSHPFSSPTTTTNYSIHQPQLLPDDLPATLNYMCTIGSSELSDQSTYTTSITGSRLDHYTPPVTNITWKVSLTIQQQPTQPTLPFPARWK